MGSPLSELVGNKTGLAVMVACNKSATLDAVWGHFGTLLMGNHDYDRAFIWKTSMKLLANEVTPKNLSTRPDCGL